MPNKCCFDISLSKITLSLYNIYPRLMCKEFREKMFKFCLEKSLYFCTSRQKPHIHHPQPLPIISNKHNGPYTN